MIGIVLVSHSAALADGLADLAVQIGGDGVPVIAAGGAQGGRLGTDGDRIAAAIRKADRGDGVAVLVDIGSAVLSVRALLADGVVDEVQVALADAPLVEGAVAAVVAATVGSNLAEVVAAAEEARSVRKL